MRERSGSALQELLGRLRRRRKLSSSSNASPATAQADASKKSTDTKIDNAKGRAKEAAGALSGNKRQIRPRIPVRTRRRLEFARRRIDFCESAEPPSNGRATSSVTRLRSPGITHPPEVERAPESSLDESNLSVGQQRPEESDHEAWGEAAGVDVEEDNDPAARR
jgi:hypothetical protein